MADGDQIPVDDVVLTEEGALPREVFEARVAAETAAPEIAETELLERRRREIVAETADEPVTAALERAASAATFGLTDLLADEESRIEMARRVEASPTAAMIGTVGGAVVPGLLSGGGGFAGALARLTPAGRVSAATARLASRGGITKAVAGGALEGMAGAAGDYVARVALEEDAEFSGEALASELLRGGFIGGALGGVADLGAMGLAKASNALATEQRVTRVLAPQKAAKWKPEQLVGGSRKPPAKWSSYQKLLRRRLRNDQAQPLRELGERVDLARARNAVSEVDELVPSSAVGIDTELDELVARARVLAPNVDRASEAAAAAFKRYGDEVGLATAKRRLTKEASDESQDALAAAVAELDQALTPYHRVADEIAARTGIKRKVPGQAASQATEALGQAVGEQVGALGMAMRVGELATGAAGLASLAGAAGVEVPGADIGGSGILGLYLKYKGIRAAAKGVGLVPNSPATRAASRSAAAADGIGDRVQRVASRGLARIAAAPATKVVPSQVASRLLDLHSTTPQEASEVTARDLESVSSTVAAAAGATAARAVGYLQATQPSDPLPARMPFQGEWQPSAVESREASRRFEAVGNPELAIDRVLNNPTATIELDALANVYPGMLAQLRADVMEQAEVLAGRLDFDQLRGLGRRLQIPLTVESLPGYATPLPTAEELTPEPLFSRPSTPGASPSVTTESLDPRQRGVV
jgi:hypothetical protein